MVGAFRSSNSYGSLIYIKNVGEDIKMKKYKIYTHKLYLPRDIARRIGTEEEKIIALLEKEKTIGRKMGACWFIRGSEILGINKIFKERKRNEQIEAGGKMVGRINGRRTKEK